MTLSELGDFRKAKDCYVKFLNIIINFYSNNSIETAKTYSNLALTLKREKNYDDAMKYYEKALKILCKVFPVTHPTVVAFKENLLSTKESFKNVT